MDFCQDTNGCCTLLILKDFGEETPTYAPPEMKKESPCAKDFRQFVARLRKKVNEFNKYKKEDSYMADAVLQNRAIIQSTTCSTQPIVEGFLTEFGFQRFGPIEKKKHKETELSVWLITVKDFMDRLCTLEEELNITEKEVAETYLVVTPNIFSASITFTTGQIGG